MKKIILKIGKMSCSACSSGLEKYLNKQNGIISANVNLVLANALIEYEDEITIEDINRYIKEAGFKSLGIYNEKEEDNDKQDKLKLIFFGIIELFILYISMSDMVGLPKIPFLDMIKYPTNYSLCLCFLSIIFLIYGMDIIKSGFKNLFHKTPNMDTLVSISVLSSFLYSAFFSVMISLGKTSYVHNLYFESVSTIIFFIKLGRYIDLKSKRKTSEAIKELVQITPQKALMKTKNGEKEVTIDEVKVDDILIAKPGMKIAVDGIIVKGVSHFDESFITGESTPVKKSINQNVVAGSINYDGYIEYKAVKIGKDSTISEIVNLVVEATNTKAPISRIADKVSLYFVPTIMLIAFLTLIGYLIMGVSFESALISFVTVLVVACPCALGLATPLAIVISVGICLKNQIVIKSSEILESASKVDTIVFDKTGTLTYGNLKIDKLFNYSDITDTELLHLVSSIEVKSTHPISNTFKEYLSKNNVKVSKITNFKNIPGIGLKGKISNKEIYVGNNKLFDDLKLDNKYKKDEKVLSSNGCSIIYVILDKKVIGLIGVKDIVRQSSKDAISKLKKLGKRVIMLTGDNDVTAQIIANDIGISEVVSNVMPKDKSNYIKGLIDKGNNVMMVGDGINDAPSLALANIGVSMNSSTDIASSSADVIIMNDNLKAIINLIKISEKTIKNIKQNLFWAFFYNICMIPISIGLLKPLGIHMNPMFAAFAMTLSSITVTFNALRLKKIKFEKGNNNV